MRNTRITFNTKLLGDQKDLIVVGAQLNLLGFTREAVVCAAMKLQLFWVYFLFISTRDYIVELAVVALQDRHDPTHGPCTT